MSALHLESVIVPTADFQTQDAADSATPDGTGNERDTALKALHGREMNSTNELYMLPVDVDEHARLDIQHEMLKVKIGGLTWPLERVRAILAPRGEGREPPAALDIGTGSGSWAVDMAIKFPHAQVVGIDLAPANVSRPVPPNCRFEVHDVNKGMNAYKNQFDAIHMRCMPSGVANFQDFLYKLFDILRPGGILLFVDGDSVHGERGGYITQEDETAPDFSWMAKITRTLFNSLVERAEKLSPGGKGASPLNGRRCQGWIREMTVWEAQDHQRFPIPMGPWPPQLSGRDRTASELLRRNFHSICASWRPALLNSGYPAETVDDWIAKARTEIETMKPHIHVGYQASWALKPQA